MDLQAFIERFGFPAAIIIFGGYALWKLASWFGKSIAEPLISTHVDFVNKVQDNDTNVLEILKSHAGTLDSIAATLGQLAEGQKQCQQLRDALHPKPHDKKSGPDG